MKKKKRLRVIPPLRKGASDREIPRWTKAHDVFDRLEAGVAEVVEGRSDLDRLLGEAVLSRLAHQRTTDATTLASRVPDRGSYRRH